MPNFRSLQCLVYAVGEGVWLGFGGVSSSYMRSPVKDIGLKSVRTSMCVRVRERVQVL